MVRYVLLAALSLAATGVAQAGALPFDFPMPSRRLEKPNPAVEALRSYSATLRTNLGNIDLRFCPSDAPNAVRNFLKLAQRGYYDGMRLRTVFKGTMVLAGDPTGDGKSDVGYTLAYESTLLPHTAGSLAMDRTPPGPNSGSRFFISLADQRHLDRDYTVFAVIPEGSDGLEVARRLGAAATRPDGGRPSPIADLLIEEVIITRKKSATDPSTRKKPGG